MTLSSFFPSFRLIETSTDHLHNALDQISSRITANLLTLNSSKTEFLLIGLSKQLAKINNSSLNTTHSARNFSFTFTDQISPVSKSCYYHIRQLRCIRPYLNNKTAFIMTTSIVHVNYITFPSDISSTLAYCEIRQEVQLLRWTHTNQLTDESAIINRRRRGG